MSSQRFSRAYHPSSSGVLGGGGSTGSSLVVPRSDSPSRMYRTTGGGGGATGSTSLLSSVVKPTSSTEFHSRLDAAAAVAAVGIKPTLSSNYLTSSTKSLLAAASTDPISSSTYSSSVGHLGSAGLSSMAHRQSRHRSMGGDSSYTRASAASPPPPLRNRSISPLRTSRLTAPSVTTNPEIVIGSRPASSASVLNRLGADVSSSFHHHDKDDEVFNAIRNRILQRSAVDRIATAANLPVSIVNDTFRSTSGPIPTSTFISELKDVPTYTSGIRIPTDAASIKPEINYSALLANSSAAAAAHEAEEIKNQIRAVKRSIGTETHTEIVRARDTTSPLHHHHHHTSSSSSSNARLSRSDDRHHRSSRKRHESEESGDHCCHHSRPVHSCHSRPLVRSNSFTNLRDGEAEAETRDNSGGGGGGGGGTKRLRARHQTLAYGVSASDLGVAVAKLNPESWSTEDFQASIPLLPIGTATPAAPQDDFRQRSRNLRGFNSDMSVVTNVVEPNAAHAAAAAAAAATQQNNQMPHNGVGPLHNSQHGAKIMNHHEVVQHMAVFINDSVASCSRNAGKLQSHFMRSRNWH